MLLETRVIELAKDNHILKCQLNAVFEKYGIKGENLVSMEQVMSTMPSNDQILSVTKKETRAYAGYERGFTIATTISQSETPVDNEQQQWRTQQQQQQQ